MLFTLDHMLTGDPVVDFMIAKTFYGELFEMKLLQQVLSPNPTVIAAPAPHEVARGR
jgi:hypothetical protein